jgi:hypothetical protein
MNKIICCVVACCFINTINAQTDTITVTKAVMDYVDAFYYGDTMKIQNSISPTVVKFGYYRAKDKPTYEGEPMSFQQMLDYASSVKKKGVSANVANFPKRIEVLDAQDQTASAKLTAWWGTDYILLSKVNNKWMVTHVLWQSASVSTAK